MRTTIDSYKSRAGRLDLEGIDFDDFKDQPLPADALRSLRYMHDVEHHTVCYLRDLLLTPAHQDPAITSFLSCWVFEEMWHGEAIGQVLEAHGEEAGAPRIAALRDGRRRRQAASTLSTIASAAFAGRAFIALHMTWGAINEWTTQAGYARLAEAAGHPTLRELLRRIMKQEGGHIDFYASEATRRLADSPKAQKMTRFALVALVAARRLGRHAQARSRVPRQLPLRRQQGCRRPGPHRPSRRSACRDRATCTCLTRAVARSLALVERSLFSLSDIFLSSTSALPPNSGQSTSEETT